MKTILLIFTLSIAALGLPIIAAPLPTATVTNGSASLGPQTNAYYFVAWATTTADGVTKNSRLGYGYIVPANGKSPETKSPWNLVGFTTYAEAANYVKTNHIVPSLPPQTPGQP